jgi:hypothetical protein
MFFHRIKNFGSTCFFDLFFVVNCFVPKEDGRKIAKWGRKNLHERKIKTYFDTVL